MGPHSCERPCVWAGDLRVLLTHASGPAPQLGVHHFALPGVVAAGSFREAAVVHVYLKGLRRERSVDLRGFVFAESAVRPWQGWGGGYLCQPHVPGASWPDLFLQCAPKCSCREMLLLLQAVRPAASVRGKPDTCVSL